MGIYFIFVTYKDLEINILDIISLKNTFILCSLIFVGTSLFGFAWARTFKSNNTFRLLEIIKFYFQGQLGKYIPGSVWSIVGRIGLVTNENITKETATKNTVRHLALLWTVCLIFGSVLFLNNLNVIILFLLINIFFIYKSKNLLFYLIGWTFIGTSYLYLAEILNYSQLLNFKFAGSALLSWFGGFIFIPAPSGIGIREFLLNFIYDSNLTINEIYIITTIMRIATILNDFIGFIIYTVITQFININKKND